ncbi:NAD-dependent epimerase/dehydratase family protein [Paenibacillus athensensis]|uniref:UDP-glucose 4-epimerase n=1 Tax=Paenibacillus athensensis TaxID=1967502 RepID=A0A4Y8PQI3_9BACL|nr:NAD-dependent epimerase/dehydratase family protein [Paenibacillus athensensis]MCD1258096.1 NAD-dependent epimerase/dehydratase family protein [Paenibacillus athensensis]
MKAIVTGGAGFIGSHLAEALLARGADTCVIDNLSTGARRHVPAGAAFHELDIRNEQALRRCFAAIRPDVVFHLAAQADVQRSIKEPSYDAAVNLLGTAHVLEAARHVGVRKIIFASTSGVYGNLERERLSENDPVAPISFYAQSKAAAEAHIRLFHELHDLPYTILRYANVYGPRQTPKGEGGVVALFMSRILSGQPLRVFGDGEQTRDFIFVEDIVTANLAAIDCGDQTTLHISTAASTSVNALTAALGAIHGTPLAVEHLPARAGDIRHSCLDNQLALALLGWQPATSIGEGLRRTYEREVLA